MLTDSDCSEYSEELESEEDTLDFDSDDDGKEQSSQAVQSTWTVLDPEELARVQVSLLILKTLPVASRSREL